MVKRLAAKSDKRIMTDVEIREKGLNKSDFTPTWQGRLHVLEPAKSKIAQKTSHEKDGEYAIKIR